jgi:hypothetical protein
MNITQRLQGDRRPSMREPSVRVDADGLSPSSLRPVRPRRSFFRDAMSWLVTVMIAPFAAYIQDMGPVYRLRGEVDQHKAEPNSDPAWPQCGQPPSLDDRLSMKGSQPVPLGGAHDSDQASFASRPPLAQRGNAGDQ